MNRNLALIPKNQQIVKSIQDLRMNNDLQRPDSDAVKKNVADTGKALENIMSGKTATAHTHSRVNNESDTQFVRYTPNQTGRGHNAGARQRVIRVSTTQVDPLEPAKFKHKRVQRANDSPPATVCHSPQRKVTAEEQADWKIPGALSNWKNSRGYTVPLHMRVQLDGRSLQDNTVSDRFAKLSDSLYAAERSAREETEKRNTLLKSIALKEARKREDSYREAAKQALQEKQGILESSKNSNEEERDISDRNPGKRRRESEEDDELEEESKRERDMIRNQISREVERDRRMEVAGKRNDKRARHEERDITEKIALGQAQPSKVSNLYDSRLFNQTAGMDSGFGHDDDYTVYDKPLFTDRTAASIYKNVREVADDEYTDSDKSRIDNLLARGPQKSLGGKEDKNSKYHKPVEFEKTETKKAKSEEDLYGINDLLSRAKKGK
mmetsp:Transcript_3308/g.3606  ORF Transcript_3308/g.3606 Transcript_3308/m.3606 type:complete len:439 (-) Transcript_3308:305-1621(-)